MRNRAGTAVHLRASCPEMPPAFVHLRAQSAYSMLEGAVSPKALAATAAALGQPAMALVDRAGLFAAMEFSEACMEKGVQPIIGALLGVDRHSLPLLAQNEQGYANLIGLVSDAQRAGADSGRPALPLDALAGRTDGLIALTGASDGALTAALADGQLALAEQLLDRLQALLDELAGFIDVGAPGEFHEDEREADIGIGSQPVETTDA